MWSRVVEFMLGCWLAVSPFVFRHTDEPALWLHDFTAASVVAVLALVSYWPPLRYAHLGIVLVAVWLIAFGRFGGDASPPAPALQNYIAVGFLLLMFAIVPNHASRPPYAWRRKPAS